MSRMYNVCVFGAGPAGTATALRLADSGVSVIVVDRSRKDKPWGGESFVGAIRHPLNVLGLWQRFCAAGPIAGYACLTAWGGMPWTQYSVFHQAGNLWHVDRRARNFNLQTLERVDDHTLRCKTAGVTYIPIPPGDPLDLAGLITGAACRDTQRTDLPHRS